VFASTALGGVGYGGDNESMGAQLVAQAIGVGTTVIYTGIVSFVLLKIVDVIVGLRVTEEQESEGLDLTMHNERGYII
jgi:ammonium transporter, Amt family